MVTSTVNSRQCRHNGLTISRKRREHHLHLDKTEARRLAAASWCWAAEAILEASVRPAEEFADHERRRNMALISSTFLKLAQNTEGHPQHA